ncbi:TNF receptor-associated factor 6-like [Oopsacas minuta]|uniref:TNF receptor-associated factor 6-like n=1 Tax=Oopsacas minuta TaxID=111878 RepID=A0AAV7KBN6_9METZ|nr:TNF receptor-associated factor 6-like [Oopsacas minuta]
MAVKLGEDKLVPDNIQRLLYVEQKKDNSCNYLGFKLDYLSQDLTDMEISLMSCSKCLGLARDAISNQGDTTCQICGNSSLAPVAKVRASVANLKIKCPLLRDCEWTGKILEGEEHLKECGSLLVKCPLECGHVIKRCEIGNHTKHDCPLREVKCQYCDIIILFKGLTDHLKVCPAHPIKCKCGIMKSRSQLAEHIETECPLTKIGCPYAEYSCKIGKIPRQDLLAHKKEFYIEHQDMLEGECNRLRKELTCKKDLECVEFEIDPNDELNHKKVFRIGSYEFECIVVVYNSMRFWVQRLASSFRNDSNIICITEFRMLLEETAPSENPFVWKERLYSQMIKNDCIFLYALERSIYRRYIQPDGKIYLKLFFDHDYITYKGFILLKYSPL